MFNETLKNLRKSRKLSQYDVAKDLKMPRSTYHMYESGLREPDYEFLLKTSEYFDVSTDYLLGKVSDLEEAKNKLLIEIEKLSEMDKKYIISFIKNANNKGDQ